MIGAPRWLNFLGDASYSIYLVHGIVLPGRDEGRSRDGPERSRPCLGNAGIADAGRCHRWRRRTCRGGKTPDQRLASTPGFLTAFREADAKPFPDREKVSPAFYRREKSSYS